MAYAFAAASSQRIHSTNTLSLSQFASFTSLSNRATATNSTLVVLNQRDVSGRIGTLLNSSRRAGMRTTNTGGSSQTALTATNTETLNAWNHVYGQRPTSTSTPRTVWLNATDTGTNTATQGTFVTELGIGAVWRLGTLEQYLTGDLAEVAVWGVGLTIDEITSLAKGFKPSRIRPQSLLYYVPLVRDLHELRTGIALTAVNAPTVVAHPRVY